MLMIAVSDNHITDLLDCLISALAALAEEHGFDSQKDQLQIQQEILVTDVLNVQGNPVIKRNVVTVILDLPVAGQTGNDELAQLVIAVVLGYFFGQCGTGTDNGHIALKYVPKLGQFIQTGAADKTADPSDPRVVLNLERGTVLFVLQLQRGLQLIGVDYHAAEFVETERLTFAANPGLGIKGTAVGIIQEDYQCQQKIQGTKYQQYTGAEENVKSTLAETIAAFVFC